MERDLNSIRENYLQILGRITQISRQAGRDSDEVKLVVVTKNQSVDSIETAIIAGAKILGENYPEESIEKIELLSRHQNLEWHMIGHLQARKARFVAPKFHSIHSLDRLRIAIKLDQELAIYGRRMRAFIEFNVSGEENKYGWPAWEEKNWDGLIPEMEVLLSLNHIQTQGLMTMPPYGDIASARIYFTKLRRLQEFLQKHASDGNWEELSMGTSVDYEIAIQEGATYVRIGQGIFGTRT